MQTICEILINAENGNMPLQKLVRAHARVFRQHGKIKHRLQLVLSRKAAQSYQHREVVRSGINAAIWEGLSQKCSGGEDPTLLLSSPCRPQLVSFPVFQTGATSPSSHVIISATVSAATALINDAQL